MDISLDKPELERFVNQQVEAGRYGSPQALVEAAVARLMLDPPTLSEEEERKLDEAEACVARGETMDWAKVSADLRHKYLKRT